MEDLRWETAEEMDLRVAKQLRTIRKRKKITQEELSARSGVSFGSVKRFEITGKISFLSLTKLALALDCSRDISNLFTAVPYADISEVIAEHDQSVRGFLR